MTSVFDNIVEIDIKHITHLMDIRTFVIYVHLLGQCRRKEGLFKLYYSARGNPVYLSRIKDIQSERMTISWSHVMT